MTTEPSKMSGYSRMSVSSAITCWILRLHCWSQGLGSPIASFQAGSWRARALASRARITARASITIRWTLFSGWASVSPSELTWTPYLNRSIFGSSTP